MEIYNLPEYGSAETYLDTGLNIHHSSSSLGQLEAMYADGTPEYVVEQGLYYPTAPNFGYICTGYEPPSDWDGHNNIFGVDSQEVQYAGSLVENFPYAYFAPSYGYTESPYNPYNPYIPGAMMRVDGSIRGSQQFYTLPSYEQQNSSPSYFPMVAQSGPDIISGGATDLFFDTHAFTASRSDVPGVRNTLSSTSANSTGISTKPASDQTRSFVSAASGPKTNAGPSKLSAAHGTITSSALSSVVPSHEQQPGWSVGAVDDTLHGKALSHRNHVRASSNIDLSDDGPVSLEKTISKFQYGRSSDGLNGTCSDYGSSYQGGKPKSHLAVEAYTNRRGGGDSDGKENIINKDEEFRLDHVNAKFFVIKSYSEDDVHKSIKYNVWSSTPNGNKKLQSAYEDAQRVCDGGCPIFLFFSVNASGQFCGVAEMIGAVDFSKDMDFWQQDKWSGSFPVKWHFIKDVPNPCLRHIILENNENKPVTNSRDTQEIRYKQGIEMLEIFKSYSVKTCLLDDFIYYENRQRMMQDEKARLLGVVKRRSCCYGTSVVDSSVAGQKILPSPDSDTTNATNGDDKIINIEAQNDEDSAVSLKIGSLTINSGKQQQEDNIVRVGSMPVVIMANKSSPGFFTVGSINLESPPPPSA